jgi:hypothetical protein
MGTQYELHVTGSRFKARSALVRSVNHKTRVVPGAVAMGLNFTMEHVSLPSILGGFSDARCNKNCNELITRTGIAAPKKIRFLGIIVNVNRPEYQILCL